jgi:SPP1 gp7 family putative phage head morphogenesis protein
VTLLTFAESIDALIEANARVRKLRALSKLERRMERRIAAAFRAQSRELMTRFPKLKARFTSDIREAVSIDDLSPLFDDAALATLRAFADPIDEFTAKALETGMTHSVADLSLDMSFTLEHPRAVQYVKDRGLRQIARINETTRDSLRVILSDAVDNGWSYDKTAREIRRRYTDMSRTRARNIAIFETGDAYEAGNNIVAKELQSAGLVMQKQWLNVGDDRVRPDHVANAAEEWIDIDDAFQSGHDRPPTDPRCRCTLQYRRKPRPRRA